MMLFQFINVNNVSEVYDLYYLLKDYTYVERPRSTKQRYGTNFKRNL